ncbi:MAG TPA: MFS transporter [Bryobacteraceae bacterium]|nr:MFS transporter [Bryobacteraceae bacterium]
MSVVVGTSSGFFGWRVVWAAFTVAVFGWGVGFYGPSVFLQVLHKAHGWPVSLISGAITCHFLVSAAIVARLPRLYQRFGLALVTRAGGISAGLGVFAWAVAAEPWQLYPAALLSGAGVAFTSGAAINAMVAPWFNHRRPAALSIAFNGASVGGLVFTPLWAFLIPWLGFANSAMAVGCTMAIALWWVAGTYLSASPASLGQSPDGELQSAANVAPKVGTELAAALPAGSAVWRDRRFATLSISSALGLFAQIGLIAFLFSFLAPALGDTGAGAAVSLTTACAIFGRTLFGMLLPAEADRRVASALNFTIQITGTLALLAAGNTSVALSLLGCALFGLGLGNLVSLPPLIAQREFVRSDVPRVVALITATNQAVFAFAPFILGTLSDLAGSTRAPILAVASVQIVAAVAVLVGRSTRSAS